MQNEKYDLLIIGSGPAGLNAALYASRANLKVGFVEKGAPGGKLSTTSKVENWLGTKMIDGAALALEFFDHAQAYGAQYIYGEVAFIKSHSLFDKEVLLKDGKVLKAKTILIATGMVNRVPTFIKNIDSFLNRGVSFCAICDGPLYGKNPTIVLGGGNSAVEESAYLSKIASEVHLVVKEANFRAEPSLVDDLKKLPNVHIYMESEIKELRGESNLESAVIVDKNGVEKEIKVASFFPYIGFIPAADFAKELNILDDKGFIPTNESMETSVRGIFAAGDIRSKEIRQIITAASEGAMAAKKISDLLNSSN